METQTDNSIFQIKTTGFEGPFNLLLNLIEKRKLFINDVSLATVTEDYLSYLNKLGNLATGEISSFVLVASTLLLIKSKSLLPSLDLTTEEEGDIKNLEERLRLYELFIRFGSNVKNNFGKRIIFVPLERKNNLQAWGHTTLIFLPDAQITKESMMTFARNVLGAMPKKIFMPVVEVRKVISIEEMIEKLTERIKNAVKMSFRENFGGNKVETIVGFLAMLELIRGGMLDANQEENDIIIYKLENNTHEPRN